jgi:hypothetical protein
MCSTRDDAALPAPGCPIRESAGQRPFSASPRLIAAVHALLRLLMPRHPPCALLILTVIKAGPEGPAGDTRYYVGSCCAVFKVRGEAVCRGAELGRCPAPRPRPVSQNSTACGGPRTVRRPCPVDVLGAGAIGERRRHPKMLPRKEVIQPHLPVRLPCYDFTPVTGPTFDGSFPRGVRPPASGVANSRGVTGGVYKARERIHRGIADPRLLATPPSCRRVSACNPN